MDMKRISRVIVALLAGTMLAGCNLPPDTPTMPGGQKLTAMESGAANDPVLFQAIKDAESARVNYKYRVQILQGFYNRIGNFDKHKDATLELKNIDRAQYFKWVGLEVSEPGAPVNVSTVDEASLVEAVVGTRRQWTADLAKVRDLYTAKGLTHQAKTVQIVIDRLDPVDLPVYLLSAELPPPTLKPTDVIPQADQMYKEANGLFWQGKGLIPGVATSYTKERRALILFKDLVQKYPTSNKIALSAYYIADIYKEYFNKDVLALAWYQRAWEWDPAVPEPARFQAAAVCERLRDFPRAVECYRASIQHDPSRPANAAFARKRIKDLTGRDYSEK